MSNAAEEELRNYTFPKTDDPVLRARQKKIAEWALESAPEAADAIRLQEARAALRTVLKVRNVPPFAARRSGATLRDPVKAHGRAASALPR